MTQFKSFSSASNWLCDLSTSLTSLGTLLPPPPQNEETRIDDLQGDFQFKQPMILLYMVLGIFILHLFIFFQSVYITGDGTIVLIN